MHTPPPATSPGKPSIPSSHPKSGPVLQESEPPLLPSSPRSEHCPPRGGLSAPHRHLSGFRSSRPLSETIALILGGPAERPSLVSLPGGQDGGHDVCTCLRPEAFYNLGCSGHFKYEPVDPTPSSPALPPAVALSPPLAWAARTAGVRPCEPLPPEGSAGLGGPFPAGS